MERWCPAVMWINVRGGAGQDQTLSARRIRSSPEVLEPARRQLGVSHRVLDVAVAEVSLQRPGIVALVGQRKATGVAQHVRMSRKAQLGLDTSALHHARKACRRERRAPLAGEYERRLGILLPLQLAQGPHFIADEWDGWPACPSWPCVRAGRRGRNRSDPNAGLQARTTADRGAAAKAQCKLPYVITAGTSGGVVMHLADEAAPQDLRLKGSPGGKNYIGPPGPAGGEKDREVVSVDSRLLITQFVEPDAAKRYGYMVVRPLYVIKPSAGLPRAGAKGEEMKPNKPKPQHWLWFGIALLAMAVITWIVIQTDCRPQTARDWRHGPN